MNLTTRLALLEALQAEAVADFQQQPCAVKRRVLDAAVHQLMRQGHLPPVDPDHPDIPLETHCREHPEAFLAWHASTLATEAWFARYRTAMVQAFFAALDAEQQGSL